MKKIYIENIKSKDNIIQDYNILKSISAVARIYNMSDSIIKRILDANNIDRRSERTIVIEKNEATVIDKELCNNVINDYKMPHGNVREIAKKYNVLRVIVKRILENNDIQIKSCRDVINERKAAGIRIRRKNPRYEKFIPTKWFLYNGIYYQGTWEFKFGLWLIQNNIKFNCHKDIRRFEYTINGEVHKYNPDFYIIDEDKFVEIKGKFTERCKEKMRIIKEMYPDVKIEIYDRKKLDELNILNIDKTLGINLRLYEIKNRTSIVIDELLKNINIPGLIYERIVNKKSCEDIARAYNISRGSTISAIIKQYLPELHLRNHTDEHYRCLLSIFSNDILDDFKNSKNNRIGWLVKKYKIKAEYIKSLIKDIKFERQYSSINELIVNDFNNGRGLTIRQLAKKYNCLRSKIKRILHHHNIDCKISSFTNRCRQVRLDMLNKFGIEIIKDLKNKLSKRAIGKKYNISKKITNWVINEMSMQCL